MPAAGPHPRAHRHRGDVRARPWSNSLGPAMHYARIARRRRAARGPTAPVRRRHPLQFGIAIRNTCKAGTTASVLPGRPEARLSPRAARARPPTRAGASLCIFMDSWRRRGHSGARPRRTGDLHERTRWAIAGRAAKRYLRRARRVLKIARRDERWAPAPGPCAIPGA